MTLTMSKRELMKCFLIEKSNVYLSPFRRNGRVVECGSLENCWGSHLRGFESLFLRLILCKPLLLVGVYFLGTVLGTIQPKVTAQSSSLLQCVLLIQLRIQVLVFWSFSHRPSKSLNFIDPLHHHMSNPVEIRHWFAGRLKKQFYLQYFKNGINLKTIYILKQPDQ